MASGVTEESTIGSSSAEAEVMMMPTILELLLPPFICLACISGGLVLWTMVHRYITKKKPVHVSCFGKDYNAVPTEVQPGLDQPSNKVYPFKDLEQDPSKISKSSTVHGKNDSRIFTLCADSLLNNAKSFSTGDEKESLRIPPLFQPSDLLLLNHLRGHGSTQYKELVWILLPVIFSLGFCPVTLLLYKPLASYLWPPNMFASPPNINDAIACFLVPAGMVYAISFGFAFQQVAGGFRETELRVYEHVGQLRKLLVLLRNISVIPPETRLSMFRVIKDMTLTSLSRLLEYGDASSGDISQGIEDLLRQLYTSKTNTVVNVKDSDPWQRSLYQRLEKLLTGDDFLNITLNKTRIHALEWAFLESLGYFTFMGILLVRASSYRVELAMCLLTVISISFLCYVVSDLDSPFHGFFQVPLDGFARLTERLDSDYNRVATEIMLENSFVDL